MRLLRSTKIQRLGALSLALVQVLFIAGCNRGDSNRGSGPASSTAAGTTTGVNMGKIAYDLLHHSYEESGQTAKMQALENRRTDFVSAVNRILPPDAGANLFPTLMKMLPMVDDGTVEGALSDVDQIIVDLMGDQQAMDGLAKLLSSTSSGSGAQCHTNSRTTNLMISRLLAYPELDDLAKATLALIRDNDGVDDNGQPNGERNILRELQAMLSRMLLNYQPSNSANPSSLQQTLAKLSDALLKDQDLKAFPNLGAPAWSVRADAHSNPKVLADPATNTLPVPFVDTDADGAADVNAEGHPVDANGAAICIAPFGNDGARDSYGRALAPGGGLYYEYYDTKRTLLSEILLLVGELLQKDVPGLGVVVLDALADRIKHDNGTPDPSDDYETLAPNSPILDLTHAQFELIKHTPLPELLKGLGAVVKNNPAKFSEMIDKLLVVLKRASSATHATPTPGGGQALANDLLPLLEDALRPRGQRTSAVRALLQAFNSEQRRLRTLPVTFSRMMEFHDYRNRIPADPNGGANGKSVMQRILDMMEGANQCTAPLAGNMADFYLDAMAGNQRLLGINININTIHRLLDIEFLRRLLCSNIKEADVRALKDFADSGALDAMRPIAKVFSDRGETPLLKNILLGLGKHYDAVMRPTEPTVVALLKSGAIEPLFEVLDDMTRQQVPGTNLMVADALADTLQAMVDTSTPRYDRMGNAYPSLLRLMFAPMDQLATKAKAKGIENELDALTSGLFDTLLQTYVDDRGTPDPADDVEKWKWEGLKGSLGMVLETLGDMIPADPTDRNRWAAHQQQEMLHLLTGRDVVLVIDLLKTIAASPQKAVFNRAIANLFTPSQNPQTDVFGSILNLVADGLTFHKPKGQPVDQQALASVLHFAGRVLDPNANKIGGILRLVSRIMRADDGLLLLRIARNAFDKGPNGVDDSPVEVLQSVFADISAAGAGPGGGVMTAADLQATLQKVHEFLTDTQHGMPAMIAKIKNRPSHLGGGTAPPPATNPANPANPTSARGANPNTPPGGAGPNGTRGL